MFKAQAVEREGKQLFQGRVEPVRFERRPTTTKRQELMVGRRGEAPLIPLAACINHYSQASIAS